MTKRSRKDKAQSKGPSVSGRTKLGRVGMSATLLSFRPKGEISGRAKQRDRKERQG